LNNQLYIPINILKMIKREEYHLRYFLSTLRKILKKALLPGKMAQKFQPHYFSFNKLKFDFKRLKYAN